MQWTNLASERFIKNSNDHIGRLAFCERGHKVTVCIYRLPQWSGFPPGACKTTQAKIGNPVCTAISKICMLSVLSSQKYALLCVLSSERCVLLYVLFISKIRTHVCTVISKICTPASTVISETCTSVRTVISEICTPVGTVTSKKLLPSCHKRDQ